MFSDVFIFVLECVGTVAFAVSGALVAISHKLDLFGVLTVGCITAVGGGITRDLLLGDTPPKIFSNSIILALALFTALVVFVIASINAKKFQNLSQKIDKINIFFDALGLAVFSVSGVEIACKAGFSANFILTIILGVITGVGGGVIRDIFVNEKPYILTKHIYAVASLIGCSVYYLVNIYFGFKVIGTVISALIIVIIRMLAAHYRWKLPKISIDENKGDIK